MQRALRSVARSGLSKSAVTSDYHLQHSLIVDLPFSLPGALIRNFSSSNPFPRPPSPPGALIRSLTTSNPSPTPPSTPPSSSLEITDAQSFNSVVSLSNTVPVVLDAYAQWCGPCKQLDPVLKQEITAHGGKIALAKLDIDLPAVAPLAQQLQIASVPTLILLFGGRAVDIKQGAPSPPELKEWIAKAIELAEAVKKAAGAKEQQQQQQDEVGGTSAVDPKVLVERAFTEARSQEGRGSIEKVALKFAAAINDPSADSATKAEATAGLALCALIDNDLATAKELLSNAKSGAEQARQQAPNLPPSEASSDSEIPAVEATLSLAEELAEMATTETRNIQELQQAIESNKKDQNAIYALALKNFEAGNMKEAVEAALLLVKRDREWQDQAGKKVVLKIADALGSKNEVGKAARRRLSNIWFL